MSESNSSEHLSVSREVVLGIFDDSVELRWDAPSGSDVWLRHFEPGVYTGDEPLSDDEPPERYSADGRLYHLDVHGEHTFELISRGGEGNCRFTARVLRASPWQLLPTLLSVAMAALVFVAFLFAFITSPDVPLRGDSYALLELMRWSGSGLLGLAGLSAILPVFFGNRGSFAENVLFLHERKLVAFLLVFLSLGIVGATLPLLVTSRRVMVQNETDHPIMVTEKATSEIKYRLPEGFSTIQTPDRIRSFFEQPPYRFVRQRSDQDYSFSHPSVTAIRRGSDNLFVLDCSRVLTVEYPSVELTPAVIKLSGVNPVDEGIEGAENTKWFQFEAEDCSTSQEPPWIGARLNVGLRGSGRELSHRLVQTLSERRLGLRHGNGEQEPTNRRFSQMVDHVKTVYEEISVPWSRGSAIEASRKEGFAATGRCRRAEGRRGRCSLLLPDWAATEDIPIDWEASRSGGEGKPAFSMEFRAPLERLQRPALDDSTQKMRHRRGLAKRWIDIGKASISGRTLELRARDRNRETVFQFRGEYSAEAGDGGVAVFVPRWLSSERLEARLVTAMSQTVWHPVVVEKTVMPLEGPTIRVDWQEVFVKLTGKALDTVDAESIVIQSKRAGRTSAELMDYSGYGFIAVPGHLALGEQTVVFGQGSGRPGLCSQIRRRGESTYTLDSLVPCPDSASER